MTDSSLSSLTGPMMSALDAELRRLVDELADPRDGLHTMICYAMGWSGAGAGAETTGKRIRPLLCLLSAGAAGGDWRAALPCSCAVEFIHSFSLIHDDIQDESPLRRGRPSGWMQYGLPHAINVGDAIFALAFTALAGGGAADGCAVTRILSATCLRLTTGQYLDLTYAKTDSISTGQYLLMIGGKTAALVAASCRLGSVSAEASPEKEEAFTAFGDALGMAFQIQDDYLGIWGDPFATGKSSGSDLLLRKKSLPILFGISHSAAFRAMLTGELRGDSLAPLIAELEACGAREYTLSQVGEWTSRAFTALQSASPQGEYGTALEELARALLGRLR